MSSPALILQKFIYRQMQVLLKCRSLPYRFHFDLWWFQIWHSLDCTWPCISSHTGNSIGRFCSRDVLGLQYHGQDSVNWALPENWGVQFVHLKVYSCQVICDFWFQFSIWHNTAGNQKPLVSGQGYILIYILKHITMPKFLWYKHGIKHKLTAAFSAEVGNILSWRLIMKYFLRSFSPFRWFKKGSCQFLAKECAQYWLTA